MGVEAGAAVRRGPACWWDGAISLGGGAALKLRQSPGAKVELGMELGMGLKPVVRLKPGAEARSSGTP